MCVCVCVCVFVSLSFTTGYGIRYALCLMGELLLVGIEYNMRNDDEERWGGGGRSYRRCPTPVTGPLPPPRRFYIHSVITVHTIKSPERRTALCGVVWWWQWWRSLVSFVPRRVYSLHTPPEPPRIRSRWKTLTRSVAHGVSDLQWNILYSTQF